MNKSCENCEYAYARFTRINPGWKCEIEDLGFKVPKRLIETYRCKYWERKGNRAIIEKLKPLTCR